MRNSKSTPRRRWLPLMALLLGAFWKDTLGAELRVPSDYSTISNSVSAAVSGDTIRIAPGDYYEQFLIVSRTNLTLQGEPGAILHATTEMQQTLLPYNGVAHTIVGVVRESDITFRGLEFHGHHLADNYSSTGIIGVVFRGSSGRIENCSFSGFRGSFGNLGRAVNVQNALTDGARISNISIFNSTFTDNKLS